MFFLLLSKKIDFNLLQLCLELFFIEFEACIEYMNCVLKCKYSCLSVESID